MNPPNTTSRHDAGARRSALALVLALTAIVATVPARAGQVRINATSGNVYSDTSAAINPGDQVVWVSTGGIHTVTGGTVDAGGNAFPDGRFNSGNFSSTSNGSFSWKSTGSGSVPYYCIPHAIYQMKARLRIVGTGVAVADFRISEVRWTAAHDHDFIEIDNLGDATGNLGLFRLSVNGRSPLALGVQSGQPTLRDIVVPSGSRVMVYLNSIGTNTANSIYWPAVTLAPAGSASLYCPSTILADTTLTNDKLMVDYVQWGAGGYRNESTANIAGFWATGNVAPVVAEGHSIEFCGTRADRGLAYWQGSPTPTPGTLNCVTPVITSSWGRIKTLYR